MSPPYRLAKVNVAKSGPCQQDEEPCPARHASAPIRDKDHSNQHDIHPKKATGGCGSPDLPPSERRIPGTAPRAQSKHATKWVKSSDLLSTQPGRTTRPTTDVVEAHQSQSRTNLSTPPPQQEHAFNHGIQSPSTLTASDLEQSHAMHRYKAQSAHAAKISGRGGGELGMPTSSSSPTQFKGPEMTMILPQVHLR